MRDALEHLRSIALEGLSVPVASSRVVPSGRSRRDDGSAPGLPADAVRDERERLPTLLRDGAAREWKRHASPWSPTLDALAEAGVHTVRVRPDALDAVMRNGTHRARGLPRQWVAVVIARLLGEELPAVREALRRGVATFVPRADLVP